MTKETPARRAWLEKLDHEGAFVRSSGSGRNPGCYCMQQGWTRWHIPPGTEGFDNREELTEEGRAVLEAWRRASR